MISLLSIAVVAALAAVQTPADLESAPTIEWHRDLALARSLARQRERPLMLVFR